MTAGLILIIAVIFFVFVLIAFSNLQSRITALQLQIQALKKHVNELGTQTQSTTQKSQQMASASNEQAVPIKTKPITEQPIAGVNQPITASLPTAPSAPPAKPIKATSRFQPISPEERAKNQQNRVKKPQDENSLTYRFTQWLIKGNPVAKVAIIILFFGLSYLLKYSMDHGLLSPEIRILGSLILGLILLIIGWKLRNKKQLYALILQGGAIGVLYFTLFAAFKLYALVPLLLTFVLLIVVCATSVMFAVLQRTMSLAVIACVGGYLAPILLSTGSEDHVALFSYYLLISTAILVISFWQSWRVLNLIGFVFTFVVAVLWGYRSFKAEFYFECQIFILANILIYGVLAVLLSVRNSQKEPYQNLFDLLLLFSVPLTAFCLQYSITEHWQYAPAFSSLGFGLFYLIGSFIVLRIWHSQAKQLALYGLAIGLGFSTLAVPLALTANWTALVWLLEGTAISCAAPYQKQYRFGLAGVIIVLLGIISAIVAGFDYYMSHTEFLTLYGVMSAIILFNACLWHYYRTLHASADAIKLLFIVIAMISWSAWIINGVHRVFESSNYIIQPIIACYVITVWIWFAIGRKINWQLLRYAVIALWPVLFLTLVNNIAFYFHTYYTGLWGLSWFAAFVSSYCYLYFDKDDLTKHNKQLVPILHISLLWIILAWLFHEISWLLSFLPWGFYVVKWSIYTFIAGLVILGFLLLQRYRRFPMQSYFRQYWQIGLLPLGIYLLFKLITGLFSSGQIIYWSYVPFINPLEEVAAFALIMLAIWLNQLIQSLSEHKQSDITQDQLSLLKLLLIITLTFLWGNSIILRSLSQWLDISWSFYALWHNNIVQVVLSLVWTLTVVILVAIAHRYLLRKVWFAGAILQVLVVLKLVFVDSIELDGLMRAFVFIGVALLMLVIGYLAPLPPKIAQPNQLKDENRLDNNASSV